MGFDYADIMPEPFYSAPEWKKYEWSKAEGVCKSEYEANPNFVFTAEGRRGRELGKTVVDGKCTEETPSVKERFWPLTFHTCRQDLTLADVKKDELVTLVFEKDKDAERQISATIIADAAVVFHVPAKCHASLVTTPACRRIFPRHRRDGSIPVTRT